MSVDFGKIFGHAVRAGLSRDRLVPFFVLYLIGLAGILLSLDALIVFFQTVQAGGVTMSSVFAFLPTAIGLVALFIILCFAHLYVQAGLLENVEKFYSGKTVRFAASLRAARPRYLSLLGATIFVGIIMFLINIIPFLGTPLSIIASWIFLFVAPAVVIGKHPAWQSLRESYALFQHAKLTTVLFWIILAVLCVAFFLLALIPLAASAIPAFMMIPSAGLLAAVRANIALLTVGAVLSTLCFAFVSVFSDSAKAFFYLDMRKTKKK